MVLEWKKNKKYQKNKKRTGPSPPRNEGEKTTVNRKLLWSRQNKRLPESLQKWGWRKEGDQGKLKERGKVMKTRPIRPKKSIKNSSHAAPQPMLWPQNKIYFHHQKSPRMGGIHNTRKPPPTPKHDKNKTIQKYSIETWQQIILQQKPNKEENSQQKLTKK